MDFSDFTIHLKFIQRKKTKKEKSDHNEDEEEEEKPKREKARRDKSKDFRTIFVGNLPITTDKKVCE